MKKLFSLYVFSFLLALNLNAGLLKDALRVRKLMENSAVAVRDIKFYRNVNQEVSYFFDQAIEGYKFQVKVRLVVKPFGSDMVVVSSVINRVVMLGDRLMENSSAIRNFSFKVADQNSDQALLKVVNQINEILQTENLKLIN